MNDEQFVTRHSDAGDIDLCFQTFGDPTHPTVLLVMGLGGPMTWWNPEFCRRIAEHGFQVVRYDNRDTGRSTKLRQHRVTRGALVRGLLGRERPPYTLSDLADDALAILDAVGVESAHIVGVSMGGMIGQTLAIEHADRVLSLTSIMSTTGRKTVGWQHPKLLPTMLGSHGRTQEAYAEASAAGWRRIGSPAFPFEQEELIRRAHETYERGWSGSGVLRHMAAVLSQPDRTAELKRLTIPVAVIHGRSDPLVHPSGGRATAKAIPGAELIEIRGMGHDLPEGVWDTVIDAIVRTAKKASV